MQEIVEIGRVAQAELRGDRNMLCHGAMMLEEELKVLVRSRGVERMGSPGTYPPGRT